MRGAMPLALGRASPRHPQAKNKACVCAVLPVRFNRFGGDVDGCSYDCWAWNIVFEQER
jgi:hypothetical protein